MGSEGRRSFGCGFTYGPAGKQLFQRRDSGSGRMTCSCFYKAAAIHPFAVHTRQQARGHYALFITDFCSNFLHCLHEDVEIFKPRAVIRDRHAQRVLPIHPR